MKRRRFFQAIASAVPAASLLRAQQGPRGADAASEEPKLETVTPAEAATPVLKFFTPDQFAAWRRLADILMPSHNGAAGASDCHAAEFLDFLVSESPDRQTTYSAGLDALNADSLRRFRKPFAGIAEAEAAAVLGPLGQPWTDDTPADPLARFLITAKAEVRTATLNSREYSAAGTAGGGGRRTGGQGLYWLPLE